jgi:enoyl-CoA hydratase
VLTEPGGALSGARELAARIAANGPLAVRVSKQIVMAAVRYSGAEVFAGQQDAVELVMASADAQEGARAFAEKRPPVWTGR